MINIDVIRQLIKMSKYDVFISSCLMIQNIVWFYTEFSMFYYNALTHDNILKIKFDSFPKGLVTEIRVLYNGKYYNSSDFPSLAMGLPIQNYNGCWFKANKVNYTKITIIYDF